MKILIIEDEKALARDIAEYLQGQNYRCEFASNFLEAQDKVVSYDYDCILLDLMLPGGSGLEILEELKRRKKDDGVIIISAKDSTDDKVRGLQTGADDYLAKPFHLSELGARIMSVIRRKQFDSANTIRINELEVDLNAKSVQVSGTALGLTKKEYDLLLLLIGNRNRIVSKNAIAEHLSGDMADMFDDHGFVYAHVKNLKRKLAAAGCAECIRTVYGTGYIWEP